MISALLTVCVERAYPPSVKVVYANQHWQKYNYELPAVINYQITRRRIEAPTDIKCITNGVFTMYSIAEYNIFTE